MSAGYPQDAILFYNQHEPPYGVFSNFAAYPIVVQGERFATSEHCFQAMKFLPHSRRDFVEVQKMPSAGQAAQAGRDRKRPLRKDWESVKDGIMLEAVFAKFTQHRELRDLLLSTGDALIVEHTYKDSYWGDGGDGSGKNMLGQTLMAVRSRLRTEACDSAEEGVGTSTAAVRQSTATTWNRERDRRRLESGMGLPEFPPPPLTEAGASAVSVTDDSDAAPDRNHFKFFAITSSLAEPVLLATGYKRVVFGDHGPYVEFSREHICWKNFPVFNEEKAAAAAMRYYDEWFSVARSVSGKPIMLYAQLRDVSGKKMPPRDGKPGAVYRSRCDERRDGKEAEVDAAVNDEGYADYVPGCFYLSPDDLRVLPPTPPAASGLGGGATSETSPAAAGASSSTSSAAAKTKKKNRLQ